MLAVFEKDNQTLEVEYGDELVAKIKEHTGLEEVTEKNVRDFIIEALRNAIDDAKNKELSSPDSE